MINFLKKYFFIFSLITSIFSGFTGPLICELIYNKNYCNVSYGFEKMNFVNRIFGEAIFVPLLETFVFQYLFLIFYFKYFYKLKNSKNILTILFILSTVCFSLSHNYIIPTIIEAIIPGLLLIINFYIYEVKNKKGFLFTFLLHSLTNLSFVLYELFYPLIN